ncbi:hypothetical protein C8Q77DRAFT_1159606 [Trametes polyzona]|nr:hypothetical protein C8Q77DRAFT_1159606 [Trametes polyzona]
MSDGPVWDATGLFFFTVIVLLNLAQLTVNLISTFHPGLGIYQASSILTFVTPLTSILLTRLFFNLQETVRPHTNTLEAASSVTQTFQIATADLEVRFRGVGPDEEMGRVATRSTLGPDQTCGTTCSAPHAC